MTIPSLAGRSILIIEDEALIALDLAQAFERAGAEVTTTSTLHHAHLLVKHDGLSAAVVDHALGDGDTQEICRYLSEHGVPYVVYSGFGAADLEASACGGVHVSKPKPPDYVVAVVEHLLKFGAHAAPAIVSEDLERDPL
jgi:DNA-binding NtrC family response regulator